MALQGIAQIEVSLAGPYLLSFPGAFMLSDTVNGHMVKEEAFCEPEALVRLIKGQLARPVNHRYLSQYNLRKYSPLKMVHTLEHYVHAFPIESIAP